MSSPAQVEAPEGVRFVDESREAVWRRTRAALLVLGDPFRETLRSADSAWKATQLPEAAAALTVSPQVPPHGAPAWATDLVLFPLREPIKKCMRQMHGKTLLRQLCSQHGVGETTLLAKLSVSVDSARADNVRNGLRGQVRCGRSWRGQLLEQIPYRDDSIPIFASKGKGQLGNALSPFNVEVPSSMMSWATRDGRPGGEALALPQKLELVWQCAKKAQGESWEGYLARRERIYAGKTPKRRYIEKGAAIAGACFGNEEDGLIEYVPSRVFYCVAYAEAVGTSPEFCLLQALVDSGFNLLILGPDGHPLDTTPGAVTAAYSDASLQFGHERVLVAMLRGERSWVDAPRCWQPR